MVEPHQIYELSTHSIVFFSRVTHTQSNIAPATAMEMQTDSLVSFDASNKFDAGEGGRDVIDLVCMYCS